MAWALFKSDVRTAARAWRVAPALPILSLLLYGITLLGTGTIWVLVTAPFFLVAAGFCGTQRIWYLRLFRGERLHRDELWPLTYAFIGRFVVLGLLMGLSMIPMGVVGAALDWSGWFYLVAFAWGALIDVVLTFVVPALSYTTASVRDAWHFGLSMVRSMWFTAKWYALAPGLAWFAIGWFNADDSTAITWSVFAVSMIGAALALIFKGAIAAFYLRQFPHTGSTGSAYFQKGQTVA